MKVITRFLTIFTLLTLCLGAAFGQGTEFTHWSASFEPSDIRAGESGRILVRVKIDEPWHMYGLKEFKTSDPTEATPLNAAIDLQPNKSLTANGDVVAPKGIEGIDKNFGNLKVEYFEKEVVFAVPVKVSESATGTVKATLDYRYQVCKKGLCDIPRMGKSLSVEFKVSPGQARDSRLAALTQIPNQPSQAVTSPAGSSTSTIPKNATDDMSLGAYLLFCFLGGLGALLFPCVFPMIPVTVSYFSKKKPGEESKPNYRGAIAYCLGIIGTFTGLGLLVTVLFGAAGVQNLGTNAWVNAAMFLIFVALALSLFGMFEISLPSGFVNKVNAKSKMGGIVGPILMGLTFTLTSFTCTVPVVGALLVSAARGDIFRPLLGMLVFSTTFAFPFFLLALFPSFLGRLPRAGSWMNTVKAFMGFWELAFAVKFLSNIDVVYQWGLVTRPIALGIWFALAILGGSYLLGWIRLGNDTSSPKIGWLRKGFGVATLLAGLACLGGMEGLSLGKIGALLPPDPYPYKDKAKRSMGELAWNDDFQKALALAKEAGKPVFVNFTGFTCTNCRDMEQNMFPRDDVKQELKDMVLLELYTDGKEQVYKDNQLLQQKLTGQVTLPIYLVVNPDGEVLTQFPGSTDNAQEFIDFIRTGKSKLKSVALK